MSPLKLEKENVFLILFTLDTFHSPIGPCGPSEQSPSGDNSRHASTAILSSDFDCGEKSVFVSMVRVGVDVRMIRNIDPADPSNIRFLVAFEWTQAAPQSCCFDTSHVEMLPLKDIAKENMLFISLTLDTSHFDMSPLECVPKNI